MPVSERWTGPVNPGQDEEDPSGGEEAVLISKDDFYDLLMEQQEQM